MITVTGTMRGAAPASAPGSDGIDEERLLELNESGAGCVGARGHGSVYGGQVFRAQLERVEVGGRRGCVTGIERLDLLPLLDILALLLLPGRREAVEQCVHFVYREDHRAAVGPGCAGGL